MAPPGARGRGAPRGGRGGAPRGGRGGFGGGRGVYSTWLSFFVSMSSGHILK